jgi:hypothetical protein
VPVNEADNDILCVAIIVELAVADCESEIVKDGEDVSDEVSSAVCVALTDMDVVDEEEMDAVADTDPVRDADSVDV